MKTIKDSLERKIKMEYFDKDIKIDFSLPDYIKENIERLIERRKNKGLQIDIEESELLSNINIAYYDNYLTLEQADLLRKKYIYYKI